MKNPEKLATFDTQDTWRRQANKKNIANYVTFILLNKFLSIIKTRNT
jgi:hypothetical protein